MSERESRVWGDEGVEPDVGDEPVEGGARYPAEWMNWILWALTTDVDTAFDDIDSVDSDFQTHENSESDVHGVGDSTVASTDDIESVEDGLQSEIDEKADDPHGSESHDSSDELHNDSVGTPTYDSEGDVPDIPSGHLVVVDGELFIEDGE